MAIAPGALALEQQVISRGLCTGCGACVGGCPYFQSAGENIALVGECDLAAASCYQSCPRTPTDLAGLDRQVFGSARNDPVLGHHRQIWKARAVKGTGTAQYGGTVTALAGFGLQRGYYQGAILSRRGAGEKPEPFLAQTLPEVFSSGGSSYTAVPSLSALKDAGRQGLNSLAVVGRPCQVTAVRKMGGAESIAHHWPEFSLVIGLFCFWALKPEVYNWLADQLEGAKITKMDIPPGKLLLETDRGSRSFELDKIRPLIRPACQECWDNTSELADVSVGAVEGDSRWNTVIVRTSRGERIFKESAAAGVLEVEELEPEALAHLRQSLYSRKKRLLAEGGGEYLVMPKSYVEALNHKGGDDREED